MPRAAPGQYSAAFQPAAAPFSGGPYAGGMYAPPGYAPAPQSMDFARAVTTCFSKYATFAGRASRAEYWWFGLFNVLLVLAIALAGVVLGLALDGETALGISIGLLVVVALALVVPSLAVTVRRLHDTDRSGAWYFLSWIPIVGGIVLFVFMLLPGTPGANRFGPAVS